MNELRENQVIFYKYPIKASLEEIKAFFEAFERENELGKEIKERIRHACFSTVFLEFSLFLSSYLLKGYGESYGDDLEDVATIDDEIFNVDPNEIKGEIEQLIASQA